MKQHSPRFLELVNNAKSKIKEITPKELKQMLNQKEKLNIIDVREEHEISSGKIPGAIHLCKGVIERDIEKVLPDIRAPMVVYCSGGFRCALVAKNLQEMGYTNVASLNSGLKGWVSEGFTLE